MMARILTSHHAQDGGTAIIWSDEETTHLPWLLIRDRHKRGKC